MPPDTNNHQLIKNYTFQPFALFSLLVANIATIVFFITSNGSIVQVLWIYWLQSIIIGSINVIRLLSTPLKGGITINDQPVPSSNSDGTTVNGANWLVAILFAMHYGFFHVGYAIFLLVFSQPNFQISINGTEQTLDLGSNLSLVPIILSGLAFAIHHTISFIAERHYFKDNPNAIPTADKLFIRPYSRIWPMHLIIIVGPVIATVTNTVNVFILFMALKTIADLYLYRKGTSHPGSIPA